MQGIKSGAQREGYELVGDPYVEVETGKGADALERRPILSAALAAARRAHYPVIVAKLDRLSRDVHFISGLRVSIVDRPSDPGTAAGMVIRPMLPRE